MVDGKPQKFEVSHAAVRAAFRREQATNRRAHELQQETERINSTRAQLEAQMKAVQEGRLTDFFPKEWNRAKRIDYLARTLKGDIEAEEQEMDPRHRELLERANKGDEAAQKLAQLEQQQQQAELRRKVDEIKEHKAGVMGKALEVFKLPKNDLTIGLMADAEQQARDEGWQMTPEALAESTDQLASEMFDGFASHCYKPDPNNPAEEVIDDDAAVALLEKFPKFRRAIHRGLIVAHQRRQQAAGVVVQQQPKPKAPGEEKKTEEKNGQPRLMNSVEEAKAYGTRGLRTI